MTKFQPTYKPYGSSAVLIEWPAIISKDILNDIVVYAEKIKQHEVEQVLEMNFVYHSLLVEYDIFNISFEALVSKLKIIYNESFEKEKMNRFLWEIPVCYTEEFGTDLALLSIEKELTIDEIIFLHGSTNYTVYGVGFLPGFLYLGGLHEKLHFPRQQTPRSLVPKGSVGIGGNQTGIYPQNSPGGWNILGKTPVSLFNIEKEPPCFIQPNDEIKFLSISKEAYFKIENLCKKGIYQPKRTVLND